jgi:hypothetical protein
VQYIIDYLGSVGPNEFSFKITKSSKRGRKIIKVKATAPSGYSLSNGGEYQAEDQGLINLAFVEPVQAGRPTVTLKAGDTVQTFELTTVSTSPGNVFNTPDFCFDDGDLDENDEDDMNNYEEIMYFGTPQGYQVTATVKAQFYENGQALTVTGPVTWTIEDVINNTLTWNREPNAPHGLTWGEIADGTTNWELTPVVGTPPNTAEANLTDIVGERTVTLKAVTTVGGVQYSDTLVVNFGKGPLSAFSKKPSATGLQWAKVTGIPLTAGEYGDFTMLSCPSHFPAANYCGGRVDNQLCRFSGRTDAYSISLSLEKFGEIFTKIGGEYKVGLYSNLPDSHSLVNVSRYDENYHPHVLRKGAALAAGWPGDIYWTGQLIFIEEEGFFTANCVIISNGNTEWLRELNDKEPFVVCSNSTE